MKFNIYTFFLLLMGGFISLAFAAHHECPTNNNVNCVTIGVGPSATPNILKTGRKKAVSEVIHFKNGPDVEFSVLIFQNCPLGKNEDDDDNNPSEQCSIKINKQRAIHIGRNLGDGCEALKGQDPTDAQLEENCNFKYTILIGKTVLDPRMIIDPN